MTPRELVALINRKAAEEGTPPAPVPSRRDTFKAGDPDTPITGIFTTGMTTFNVLRRAVAAGRNMIIPHEDTYFRDNDVTDFLGDDPWAGALGGLVRRHDVIAVHVTDLRELTLPDVGMLAVVDTETGRQRYVQSASSGLRARYAAAAAARHGEIVRRIESTGAAYLHLSTDRDWLGDTVRFASELHRARRARPADTVIARFRPAVTR